MILSTAKDIIDRTDPGMFFQWMKVPRFLCENRETPVVRN